MKITVCFSGNCMLGYPGQSSYVSPEIVINPFNTNTVDSLRLIL